MSFRFLSPAEWRLLRDVRLDALKDSPTAFLSSYEDEAGYGDEAWADQFDGGEWLVDVSAAGTVLAVVGATTGPDIDPDDRYLSHLWVAPAARRTGLATELVGEMLRHLRASGRRRAWLWVLDGNDAARALYRKLGFVSTEIRQSLQADPTRYEERFTRPLA